MCTPVRATPAKDSEQIVFIPFDVPTLEKIPFHERHSMVQENSKLFAPRFPAKNVEDAFRYWKSQPGIEGLVLRTDTNYYVEGRSKSMWKYKEVFEAEAPIVNWIEGKGKFARSLGAVVCWWNNQYIVIGRGTLTTEEADKLWKHRDGKTARFEYRTLSTSGKPQQPILTCVT